MRKVALFYKTISVGLTKKISNKYQMHLYKTFIFLFERTFYFNLVDKAFTTLRRKIF